MVIMIYGMFLKEKSAQNHTESIVSLLEMLMHLIEEKDIDPNVFQLQSNGFKLESIDNHGYAINGIFKKKNCKKEIQIPFYKINEDILEQLEFLAEGYNTYLLEDRNMSIKHNIDKIEANDFIDLNSNEINWEKVYNTRSYAQVALNTTVELLCTKLNEQL